MTKQEQNIDREFLTIEPLDTNRLDEFYNRHKSYFTNGLPNDTMRQEKYMTMICEIGNSYSFSGRHKDALDILRQAEKIFKTIGADNKTNATYNSIIFCLANSNLALNNYFRAFTYFNVYFPTEKEKKDTLLLIQICKDKIKNKLLLVAGIIGFAILTIKYSIKWFSPDNYSLFIQRSGWVGAILLLTYGLMTSTTKRKNNR